MRTASVRVASWSEAGAYALEDLTAASLGRQFEVVWFAGTRRPRTAELDAPVAALEAALDIRVTQVTTTREDASLAP